MPTGIYKRTPEHCAAMSKAHTGVPLSPEHCDALSEASRNSEAVKAANEAKKGVPKSPETCAAMSVAHTGVPHSPEHITAIKKGQEKAGTNNAMRGGLDLCWHHVAYDFGRPDALRILIIRKFHAQIHNPKGLPVTERGYSLID